MNTRLITQDGATHEEAELLNYVNGGGKFRVDTRIVYATWNNPTQQWEEGGVDTASLVPIDPHSCRSIWQS